MPNDSDLSCQSELDSPELEPPSVVELELEPDDDDEPESLPEWETLDKILLPSAVHLEERLTVSQSVPEPASRQLDRYTQVGFFVSGRCGPKQQEGSWMQFKQWPSGIAADRHS